MSDYASSIFGTTPDLDVSDRGTAVQVIAAMYRLGAILDRATILRARRDSGETLNASEARFLALADEMLEQGLDPLPDPTGQEALGL